jgi:large subunit ribosomal protein L6
LGGRNVEGPLGKLSLPIPEYLNVDIDEEAKKVMVTPQNQYERKQREMWGSTRAMLQNHITGVSEGHVAILRLVGVGYRASIENGGKIVNLKVQYAHPVELEVPEGVKASTPQPTRILLEGSDKEVVKQFAADIRKWRVPEPYKGKVSFAGLWSALGEG